MSLALALAGTLAFAVGCSQGEGDRCEIPSDCASGLECSPGGGGPNAKTCQKSNTGTWGSTGQDAASDVPLLAADASIDTPVAADGATVDGATAPDAEAADDSSATD